MAAKEFSFIGKGRTFLAPYAGAAAAREIGNVSELIFAVTEDTKDLQNFQVAGGGKANQLRRVQDVGISMNMRDFIAENIALAVFGTAAAVVSGSVTDESRVAYKGGLVRTSRINISAVVVTNAGATVTYVLGTDYEVVPGGIIILAAGAIVDAQTILIDYAYTAQQVVEALITSAQEWKLNFVGLNEAQSGKPVVVDIHRAKFGATSGLPLIGDDFAELPLTGEALSDPLQAGGVSKFFTYTFVDA